MNKTSFLRHPLITGTITLTLAGLLSRMIGFFYRIFLSHTIGAEGLGIYQLIFPVYALTFSLTAAGIQTAISKYVAEVTAKDHILHKKKPSAYTYLYTGLILSLLLSFCCTFLLYHYADFLAVRVLEEQRCTPLLQILSFTVPFGAIHSCINGYYYGLQKTVVPATSQLIEQLARVGGVYILYQIALSGNHPITVQIAVWGLVIGEIASVLYSVSLTRFSKNKRGFASATRNILTMACPLTAGRVLLNLFQSAEAILIPVNLRSFGYSGDDALSVFGVLTGMAMPMVLFPCAITNSVSVMLLPAISEAWAAGNKIYIKNAVKRSCFYCITLGLCCTLGFLLLGQWIGTLFFANKLAGTLIMTLSWICPFLYLTTTLSSIINGLGKTSLTFLLNIIGTGIRILSVVCFIPIYGLKAYMIGILLSYLAISAIAVAALHKLLMRM